MTNKDIKLIKDELLTNKDISNYDRKVILHLVNELRNEKLNDISMNEILNDISNISDEYKIADNTNVTDDRINRLLYIVDLLSQYNHSKDYDTLVEASYLLDCLYYDSDLDVRKTNTILNKIKSKNKFKEVKKERII